MNNLALIHRIERMLADGPMNNASVGETAARLGLGEMEAAGLDVLLDFTPEYRGPVRFVHGRTHDGHTWSGFVLRGRTASA